MRFSNLLRGKLLKWCSNDTRGRKLLEDLSGYNSASTLERSAFLNKVSVLMGYNSIDLLVEQERVNRTSGSCGHGLLEEFDFTSVRGRFPCIKVGDSPFVELYDEVPLQQEKSSLLLPEGLNKLLPGSVGETWAESGSPLTSVSITNASFSSVSQEADLAGETKSSTKISSKRSATNLRIKSPETKMLDEQILDKTVSCIPRVTIKQCHELEGGGFHTVRKLPNHFPRTYVDLQNAQGAIVDGQYLICIGTILSSRVVRATSSMSFLELVVSSQISDRESVSETMGDDYDIGGNMVYLHLKRSYFGRHFEQGDKVRVSGKVKKMREDNHYDLNQYKIDILEEEEQHVRVERRPHPLYPSKLGLNPHSLEDMISREVSESELSDWESE